MANDRSFDPYHEWLAIPPESRPPTHYQILGIARTETNQQVIETAAVRQSAFIRTFQKSARAEFAAKILEEIQTARSVLIDPVQRRTYDAKLPADPIPKPARPEARPASKSRPNLVVVEVEKIEIAAPFERGAYKLNSAQVPIAEVRKPRQRIDAKANRSTSSASSRHTITLIAALATIVVVVAGGIFIFRSGNKPSEAQSSTLSPADISGGDKSKEIAPALADLKQKETPFKLQREDKPTERNDPPIDRPKDPGDSKGKESGSLATNLTPKSDPKEPTKTAPAAPIDPKAWWASVPRLDGKTSSAPSSKKSLTNLLSARKPDDNVDNELLVDAAIRAISSQDDESIKAGLRQLTLCEPNHRVAEVFDIVEPFVTDVKRARAAMYLLGKWDMDSAFDIVEPIVTQGTDVELQAAAMATLAVLHDRRGLEAIATHFGPKKQLRHLAAQALTDFGSDAETTVLAGLSLRDARNDQGWYMLVIQILDKIGTKKSITALRPYATRTGKDREFLNGVASRAIEHIERRMEMDFTDDP